jgi:hypothetical protein
MKENQLSRYGAIARSLPYTTGKVFFVKPNTDADFADFLEAFPADKDGVDRVYTTVAAAAAATQANRYDIVVVPDATYLTAANQALLASTARLVALGIPTDVGTVFTIQKTITSSTITTSAQDLTLVSGGGELLIEDVILKTDGTGLAGPTNFRILSNNAKGAAAILEETVANLGANKTVNLDSASVAKQRTILESGKKLQFLGTAAGGTGAGTVQVTVKFRRLSPGAVIAAA